MTLRKEVFQSKVLEKLYPAAPKQEKEHSPPCIVDALSRKPHVKRKTSATGDAGTAQSAANPGRRMYTVLPPPADYKADSEKSVSLHLLENINSADDPAEESVHDSNEGLEEEEEVKRKRKRRKRKPTVHQDGLVESSTGVSQTPVDGGGEHISRNRKRKLKKKRHKEKLLAMGLMPQASALEFTYRRDGEEEEEEEEDDDERRAAEVSDFLRTTMEIYLSDSSHVDELPLLSGTVNDLLSGVASGHHPTSVLKQLCRLKAFVQRQQTDKLEKALQELHNASVMSAEETTAVASLFQYWITDIFPMQGDKKTEISALQP